MLLCYVHRDGTKIPDLCLMAERTDEFSVPVSVEALCSTEAASIRLGPYEGINVWQEEDGGIVVEPVKPTRVFLTPSQPDLPGHQVSRIKIIVDPEHGYKTFYQKDRAEWLPWNTLKDAR